MSRSLLKQIPTSIECSSRYKLLFTTVFEIITVVISPQEDVVMLEDIVVNESLVFESDVVRLARLGVYGTSTMSSK